MKSDKLTFALCVHGWLRTGTRLSRPAVNKIAHVQAQFTLDASRVLFNALCSFPGSGHPVALVSHVRTSVHLATSCKCTTCSACPARHRESLRAVMEAERSRGRSDMKRVHHSLQHRLRHSPLKGSGDKAVQSRSRIQLITIVLGSMDPAPRQTLLLAC